MAYRSLWQALLRQKWLLVSATLLGGLAALLVSSQQVPRYEARADLLIERSPTDGLFINSASADKTVQTEVEIVTSPPVRQAVLERLGRGGEVVATFVAGSDVFSVIAKAADASTAAALANAYAESYVEIRQRQAVDELVSAQEAIRSKIGDLQAQIDRLVQEISAGSGSERLLLEQNLGVRRNALVSEQAVFQQQLDQLEVAASVRSAGVKVLRAASPPAAPAIPATERNVFLGLTSGLGLGLAFAVLRKERS